ncbi:UDP-glucuronic acid decarboxylase family protein [Nanoarchaeota archaeon]
MKRILVTGGAGFLGSHLCDYLIEQGYYVICVDNFFTGMRENIAHLMDNPNFELIEHDVIEYLDVDVDEIYNLASPASPIHYRRDPVKTTVTNVMGTIHALNLAKEKNAKILLASTSEVYGDPEVHPQTESYTGNVNPVGFRSCYDEGKRCAETLMADFEREYSTKIRIVRIFNTYGPRMAMDDGRVVSNFIVQALKGEDITIYGDGSQTRSFQYATDLIIAMVKMMEQEGFTGPVNLGNPNERTIRELAEAIVRLTGSKSKIIFQGLPEGDPTRRCPDISLAKEKLGWEPVVPLDEGLHKTIDYFKGLLS